MLSYTRIREISKMFDPSINISLYDHIDFEDDIDWNYTALNYPLTEFIASTADPFDFARSLDEEPLSPQSQIRNHDCMWSGRCTTHPNECLGTRNSCHNKYVNEAELKKSQATQQTTQLQTAITDRTTTISSSSQMQNGIVVGQKKQQQNIPPGRSLLRLNQAKPSVIKVPNVSTNDFLKDREFIARPDTPLSLDDDPPEFKHTIDLAACTMGSNKMSLITDSPTEIINILKEHLEDENSNQIQMRNKLSNYLPSITKSESIEDLIKDIRSFSDFEDELDEDEDEEEHANESDSTDSGNASTIISSQSSANSTTTTYENTQSMHSDHSYTRSKSRVDVIGLGVQTPSDSEEEIDVVSVGDKNLPTNPSAKDRRALQTTVAHKITARIVKTSTGIRTIPPRRRCSNVSSDSSGYTFPSSRQNPAYTHHYAETISTPTTGTTIPRQQTNSGSRKRANPATGNNHVTSKRSKVSKKLGSNGSTQNTSRTVNGLPRRQQSDNEESETIEKRNLHNDMERQRRIGLKNLFENLKDKIPSLREKDRAPKVNILREATTLCNKLTRDEVEYESLKRRQQRLLQRLKQIRASVATLRGNVA